jgi:hypothetical protein
MRFLSPLLILLFITNAIYSQGFQTSLGPSKTELELTTYERDSSARALVLYRYGNSYFNKKTFKLNIEKKEKIKVLKEDGLDIGNYEIALYKNKSGKELLKDIRVISYNLVNGQIEKTELSEDQIYREVNQNYDLIKFAVPKVKIGTVFSVSYRKITPFTNKFEPWDFQGEHPVIYSEYNTSIPGNFEYHIKLVGSLNLDEKTNTIERHCLEAGRGAYADCAVSKYVMTNIPAYKEESYTTTRENYRSRIEYELAVFKDFQGGVNKYTKTWEDVEEELKNDQDFGRQLKKQSLVKGLLPEEIAIIDNDLDKARAIYNYVLNNYTWDGSSGRFDVSVNRIIDSGVGNVFEINLLLLNFLRASGIEAFPVLSSTRNHGFVTKIYPVLTDFTYLFVKTHIDNKDYYLDATNKYMPFGELPFRLLNGDARLIDFKDGSRWESVDIKSHSVQAYRLALKVLDHGLIEGQVNRNFLGYFSLNNRRQYFENKEAYITNLENRLEDYHPKNISFSFRGFSEKNRK